MSDPETLSEQLKESKEAFSALKKVFNELLKEARTKAKSEAEQLKASREAFDELLKAHQGLVRHSGSIAVGLVSLKLEQLGESVDKRFTAIGRDPRITPLQDNVTDLEARMASTEISQERNRTTYKDIRDAQNRLEKAVSAKPPAHVPDEFDPPEGGYTESEQNGP